MMAEMAEFITRVNYGMKNGNFEMDYRDGEIRYKVYVDCEESLPDDVVIKNGIFVISSVFRRYANGITGIIFGGMSGKKPAKCAKTKTYFKSSESDSLDFFYYSVSLRYKDIRLLSISAHS